MVCMHSIASSRLVSSSGGFRDRPSCLSTGRLSSELPAARRRVGLVRCVGEGRPLHIADGSVSCVPCARVCVMVVHVHDALVEIQSLVRRKPCLVLYPPFFDQAFYFYFWIYFYFVFIHFYSLQIPAGMSRSAVCRRRLSAGSYVYNVHVRLTGRCQAKTDLPLC